ncbi:GNAT family N-acetyltransferase [Bacillus sp. BGMRC 2118]|nr:GNAT family N-acetyltransferase [Bacillus sp. BGMRC 2118]
MLTYRKATINDIEQMIELRKIQLIDEGLQPTDIDKELYDFFSESLSEGRLIQYLVEDGGKIVASGAVMFYDFPPSFSNPTGKKAYFANMYTDDQYRGKGIATNLLTRLVEEVRLMGVSKIWLAASEMGRPVYKKFGFTETNEYLELNLTT